MMMMMRVCVHYDEGCDCCCVDDDNVAYDDVDELKYNDDDYADDDDDDDDDEYEDDDGGDGDDHGGCDHEGYAYADDDADVYAVYADDDDDTYDQYAAIMMLVVVRVNTITMVATLLATIAMVVFVIWNDDEYDC